MKLLSWKSVPSFAACVVFAVLSNTAPAFAQIPAAPTPTKDSQVAPPQSADDPASQALALEKQYQWEAAIKLWLQILTQLGKQLGVHGQAILLNLIGRDFSHESQPAKAIDYFSQALPLFTATGDKGGEAKTLDNIGSAYLDLSQPAKAIGYYNQALSLYQAAGNKVGEATTDNNIGLVYLKLNQPAKALDYYNQALPIFKAAGNQVGQAATDNNIGSAYDELSQPAKGIEYYTQALPILNAAGDKDGEATVDSNIGYDYNVLSQPAEAIGYFTKALPLHQAAGDKDGEAGVDNNIGYAYNALSQSAKAVTYYAHALPLFNNAGDQDGLAVTYANLMDTSAKSLHRTSLAVLYGKQAVNLYQTIRGGLTTLDSASQKTYLKSKEPTYRQLADLLIKQGRFAEAEQVLGLLKEQEFFDFVRRDPTEAPAAERTASLSPDERLWQTKYDAVADKITQAGAVKQTLLDKQTLANKGGPAFTTADAKDLAEADAKLTLANQAFSRFLDQLADAFDDAPKQATDRMSRDLKTRTQDKVDAVSDAKALATTLRTLGPGAVALYTIVLPDKYRVLLVTSQTQIARSYPITDTELNKKVFALRQVLQDPTRDPRPQAQELYKILVAPIAGDLKGAHATTLMWSLDGALRYLPMAALYDGQHYLAEDYQNVVFTPASIGRLTDAVHPHWSGLGLGVSLEHHVKSDNGDLEFPALLGVPKEMGAVFEDQAHASGVLPGDVLMDGQFTAGAMTTALEHHTHPLVHIASHFDFRPGDFANSVLLLGDGTTLSLEQIDDLPQPFQGVDLLTLSACETAVGDGAGGAKGDGREVEGLGVLAQRQGAEAVLASLWPVSDASTPVWMTAFYRAHESGAGLSKAAALQAAQVAMIHGSRAADSGSSDGKRQVLMEPGPGDAAAAAPAFTPDPKAPYAHPYYWAPFILIGNWK